MSDSESSDDDILRPNGFVDVDAESVGLDFDVTDGSTPPPSKKRRRKNGKTVACESFTDSIDLSQDSPVAFVIHDDPDPVLVNTSSVPEEEVSLDEICARVKKSQTKRNASGTSAKRQRKSRRIALQAPISIEDESEAIIVSPEASPKHDFEMSLTQSSFSFDLEEVSLSPAEDDPNSEVDIRVVWKGCKTRHFTLRKFQKIKEIYTHYAQEEGISEEQILFTLRDKPVSPNDTPLTLKIGVSSLEGGVVDLVDVPAQMLQNNHQEDPNAMKLLVQRQGNKERHTVYTYAHEKISVLISKLSEDLKIQSALIRLRFDGEILDASSTPGDYDLEGDEVIDLIISEVAH